MGRESVQSGRIFQIAYVTRNLAKGMATLRAQTAVRAEYTTEVASEVLTPDGPAALRMKLAFLWVADAFHYELIEPVSGLEHIYAAALPDDDSLRFHHTCARVDDWDEFRRGIADQSHPVAFESNGGANRLLYLDARKTVGHYLEFACITPEFWQRSGGK